MRKREDHAIRKHTLNLFEGAYERLQGLYPHIGAAKIIRDIVRAHIKAIENKAQQFRGTDHERSF